MKLRRTRYLILFLLLAVTVTGNAFAGFSMDVLDVGAGDCLLLQTDDAVMMIDCGPARAWDHIGTFLRERNISRIDTLVLTHSHPDHCGNVTHLFAEFSVGEILISSTDMDYPDTIIMQTAEQEIPLRSLTRGDHISLGEIQADVLWPALVACELVNDRSVVIRVSVHDFHMLLMGDAESEAERYLLNMTDPSLLRADLIKLGHHGMLTSSTYPLIRAVQPTYALVSCADSTHNATLSPVVRDTLEECDVSWILTTDAVGDIHLEISNDGMLTIR